jgi:sugar phosphate isomerase/epimerase
MQDNKLSRVYLSIYSFGYSASFINDTRPGCLDFQTLTPMDVAEIAKQLNLGGIEIPVDKYFSKLEDQELINFINNVNNLGININFDLENFDSSYLKRIAPIISNYSNFIRIKVSNFYGGNRFKNKDLYYNDFNKTIQNIDESLDILKNNNLKILVENHQDIVLDDIKTLINMFGADTIGVNWDIGNSLPSGETVESFISKVGNHIGNVHLKDYMLYSCDEGYVMKRCSLGKGFVDFNYCINNINNNIPLAIELGALNSRKAEVNNPEYWKHTKGISQEQKENFMEFIKNNVVYGDYRSFWELGLSPKDIAELEMTEMNESINFLKTIL